MRLLRLLILSLLIILVIVGLSNYSINRSKLPLVAPINVPRDASMQEKLTSIDRWLYSLSKEKQFNGAILISNKNKPDLINIYGYQDVNKEIQDVNQVMHCCLDVQSNFVLIKQNFLVERKILFAFAQIDKDTYKKQYPNNYSLIRAPPNLSKI